MDRFIQEEFERVEHGAKGGVGGFLLVHNTLLFMTEYSSALFMEVAPTLNWNDDL